MPFFGAMGLSEITAGKVQDYRIHRHEEAMAKRGKPPAHNTMHQEIVTLRQTLKTALRHGWLDHLPDLSEPYRSSPKISHRAWFSPEEYKQLYEATRKRAHQPRNARYKWESEQLHDYVLFSANTGLRPDEARRLQFRDVTIVEDEGSGQTILEIEVRGKRGVGYCKSMTGAVRPFERLKARLRPHAPTTRARRKGAKDGPDNRGERLRALALAQPTDLLFPKWQREQFKTILEEENLKVDRDGRPRTAYSLRHTYICLRLLEGADIYQIAKNCRTSVEMIEKYYAAHIKTNLDAAAINVMKPRPKKDKRKDARTRKTADASHGLWQVCFSLAAKPTESPLDYAMIYRRAGVAEWQTRRTQTKLECSPGNRRCRTAQSRGNLNWQSRAKPEAMLREGVETRRAAPTPRCSGHGEGIVQTPNLDEAPRASFGEGGESRRGKKIRWSQGRVGSTPSARTIFLQIYQVGQVSRFCLNGAGVPCASLLGCQVRLRPSLFQAVRQFDRA